MNEHTSRVRLAERLLTAPKGATMDEIAAAAGGPQYNLLRRLMARGYRVRKLKEGRATRYFATPPVNPTSEATITSKGQVTIPKEVRDALGLRARAKVTFTIEPNGRVAMRPAMQSIQDLFGILGKPRRSVSIEEMDEAIKQAAVDRYLKAVGRKKP